MFPNGAAQKVLAVFGKIEVNMILFADGREFRIAGVVISDGITPINFADITIKDRPSSFPLSVAGIEPPIVYVNLVIAGVGEVLTAMSSNEYNTLAIAEANRQPKGNQPIQPAPQSRLNQVGNAVKRLCGSCGR